ncbi:MAG: DUF4160 domain-containing protein [Mucilaginibacter sp.]|uniref:DUF4160 domain-containing protein n=1 Tax=Mucilaginibacter sp. TaxID=1882438 RepID=UPI0034E61A1D
MGKLLILSRYIFLIYATDIYESRKHIHVAYNYKGPIRSCKFWLEPDIKLDENKKGGFTTKELLEIKNLIVEHQNLLLKQLALFYNHQQIKIIKK